MINDVIFIFPKLIVCFNFTIDVKHMNIVGEFYYSMYHKGPNHKYHCVVSTEGISRENES